ncbi:MAG: hypothetical protein ABI999_11550 [Acidobacteriota bacterium]
MKEKSEMDDILNEFTADFKAQGDKALEQYIREYPELTEVLYEHAGMSRMFRHLPEAEMTTEEEELRVLKSVSLVQNLLHERRTQMNAIAENEALDFNSLRERLDERNVTYETAAADLRLSPLILKLLDKRKVRPGSLPRLLLEKLSGILETNFETTYAYFSLKPIPSGGFYRADSAPTFPAQSEFADLVKYDPDLSPTDKDYWIALPTIEQE